MIETSSDLHQKSSVIFGGFRKEFANVLTTFGHSSEIFEKWSKTVGILSGAGLRDNTSNVSELADQ